MMPKPTIEQRLAKLEAEIRFHLDLCPHCGFYVGWDTALCRPRQEDPNDLESNPPKCCLNCGYIKYFKEVDNGQD